MKKYSLLLASLLALTAITACEKKPAPAPTPAPQTAPADQKPADQAAPAPSAPAEAPKK